MARYTLDFSQISAHDFSRVGGKGFNLGVLSSIAGIRVPDGFCVTTEAFDAVVARDEGFRALLRELNALAPEAREETAKTAAKIRAHIETLTLPEAIAAGIEAAQQRLGTEKPLAVRSSATAEDLPGASFAGQQDTFLNVRGGEELLTKVRACWASLYTERAAAYRRQNGFAHESVSLCVVVQEMIFPESSGILFTADPVSGNRKTVSIDAGFGLGEALVSGVVSADNYKVRDGAVAARHVSQKKIMIRPLADGGTEQTEVPDAQKETQVLTDAQILTLAKLGRRIEAYFSEKQSAHAPQDIEWALADGAFYILQSRPITTLYPIPETADDKLHLYLSMGHTQMMTDEIRPLGMSFFKLFVRDYGELDTAGGRMFIDISKDMKSRWARQFLLSSYGKADMIVRNILERVAADKTFLARLSDRGNWIRGFKTEMLLWAVHAVKLYRRDDWDLVEKAVARNDDFTQERDARFENVTGPQTFTYIKEDSARMMKEMMDPNEMALMFLWMAAMAWLQSRLGKWLDEPYALDLLSKSVPCNPTSEMGLLLHDISLLAGERPDVAAFLRQTDAAGGSDNFMEELAEVPGGEEVCEALAAFLARYGARCSGEIDITRTRWNERPSDLVPMILNNIAAGDKRPAAAIFEAGRLEAEKKAEEIVQRLKKLHGGGKKAKKFEKWLRIWRSVSGFREIPKYSMIRTFWTYKKAILREAEQMRRAAILEQADDVFYLTMEELIQTAETGKAPLELIRKRREEYRAYAKLTPPRAMTSEGEILQGGYSADGLDIPAHALPGMPVSAGVAEGRARVVLRQQEAKLEAGDILVTKFTDPSWTPLFLTIRGLVTEVGGQMTHGAVITREYGLPAVVGVENATTLIADGARIRVDGTQGYVEILEEPR